MQESKLQVSDLIQQGTASPSVAHLLLLCSKIDQSTTLHSDSEEQLVRATLHSLHSNPEN